MKQKQEQNNKHSAFWERKEIRTTQDVTNKINTLTDAERNKLIQSTTIDLNPEQLEQLLSILPESDRIRLAESPVSSDKNKLDELVDDILAGNYGFKK